jgi:RNA-splicing ligase RtcB
MFAKFHLFYSPGGVVSAGGVGFDISCGARTMLTGLTVADIVPVQKSLSGHKAQVAAFRVPREN